MGRDRKNETRKEHFARLDRKLLHTPAWIALSPTAKALYPYLKLEWGGPNNNNNGKIRLSVRCAAEFLGVSKNTASKAFQDLQAKGFLFMTKPATLGCTGQASCPEFEITEIALPGTTSNGGRATFKDWQPGSDYSVQKSRTNNPAGRNGKTKPHLKNEDRTVLDFGTSRKFASQK